MTLIFFAPIFILFEVIQLIVAERFIGVKQIKSEMHPLESGINAPDWLAALWLASISLYLLYMFALMLNPWGGMQGFIMLFVSLVGVALRRTMGVKWALVIMTIEGAVRMGLLANLLISAIFHDSLFSQWSLQ